MQITDPFVRQFIYSMRNTTPSDTPYPARYLPVPYPNESSLHEGLLSLLAGGEYITEYPYSYDCSGYPAYCILYTESGSGYLSYDRRTYYLDPGSLVMFQGHKEHHIEIQHSPWKYKVLYLSGRPLEDYYEFYSQSLDILLLLGKSTHIPEQISRILAYQKEDSYTSIERNRILTDLLTMIVTDKIHFSLPKHGSRNHIVEMKQMFDSHYEFHYTLEWLEEYFGISRYRLCREFKEYEGISPMAYLNVVRMRSAKNLLLNTDLRINEIAQMVGIENPNHFIRLFKASAGSTPSAYRN